MVKAIDMQVLIPRSHDVGKIQQLEVQKHATQNYHTGAETHQKNTLQQTSVNKMDQMINDNIRDNKEGRKGDSFESQSGSKDDKDILKENEVSVVKNVGNIVDIHI